VKASRSRSAWRKDGDEKEFLFLQRRSFMAGSCQSTITVLDWSIIHGHPLGVTEIIGRMVGGRSNRSSERRWGDALLAVVYGSIQSWLDVSCIVLIGEKNNKIGGSMFIRFLWVIWAPLSFPSLASFFLSCNFCSILRGFKPIKDSAEEQ